MLLTVNPIAGEYYNIGGTYTCRVGETLDTLISFSTRKDIKKETDPQRLRPIDADLQIPDTSKFMSHTGWKPEITYEQTMRDLLEYWRERIEKHGMQLAR
jgi:GDPmannose 4,6-dehydratase